QKQDYLNIFSNEINYTVSLHLLAAPQNPDAARLSLITILQRKGRTLDTFASQIGMLRQHAAPEDRAMLEQLASVRTKSTTLILKGQGNNPEAKQLETEADSLEDAISRRSAEFRSITQPITLERIATVLPLDAALVEMVVYQPFNAKAKDAESDFDAAHYAAYVLRP